MLSLLYCLCCSLRCYVVYVVYVVCVCVVCVVCCLLLFEFFVLLVLLFVFVLLLSVLRTGKISINLLVFADEASPMVKRGRRLALASMALLICSTVIFLISIGSVLISFYMVKKVCV